MAFFCGEGFNIVRVRATAKVKVMVMVRFKARVLSRISAIISETKRK